MRDITWQWPFSPQFSFFCAITRYEGGASIAACGGRWTTKETLVLIGVDVGKLECPGCRDALDAALPVAKAPRCDCGNMLAHLATCPISRLEVALRELRLATPIVTQELHTGPGVLFEGVIDGQFDDGGVE